MFNLDLMIYGILTETTVNNICCAMSSVFIWPGEPKMIYVRVSDWVVKEEYAKHSARSIWNEVVSPEQPLRT